MSAVQLRRWTRQEYNRMIEAGVLTSEDRVELIDGEILAATPQGSAHATAVSLTHEALRRALGSNIYIRVRLPLALASDSEPEPDIAVVAGCCVRDYRDAHPHSALLVVEVADATLAYDREVKSSLYARAGIPEYWIVNLLEGAIEVHRSPAVTPDGGSGWQYRTIDVVDRTQSVALSFESRAVVAVADLLP